MKRLIAVFLVILLAFCAVGCEKKSAKTTTDTVAKREFPLKYGVNAHIYEQRTMDPSSTMDYVTDMIGTLGVEYYRLSTTLGAMFSVGDGDTLTFNDGYKNIVHQVIEKLTAVGVTNFVACSDTPVYPYGYEVTASGVVPDPATEKEMYIRFIKLYAKAWGMIAKEFPEITHIEPMNEPDLAGSGMITKQGHQWGLEDGYQYSLTDKAHILADFQYYIYKEAKAANPKVKVCTPGLSTHGEAVDIMEYIYEAIESGAHPYGEDFADVDPDHYFDTINFHNYLNNDTVDQYFEHCDTVYKASEKHNDAGKPALITEWGFTDFDSEAQEMLNGENMVKMLKMFDEKMPYVEAALIYCLNDLHDFSVDINEDNYGLFTSRGDPEKPSCPKPVAIEFYKYIHKTEDVSPLYKYCPELKP